MEFNFKELISNKEKEFKIFIKKYKEHLEETGEAKDILIKYLSGENISKQEIKIVKDQSIEIIKSMGIGIPTILLPGGLALLAFIIWLSKRYKMNILPNYLKTE
jgi:hypothetical protein